MWFISPHILYLQFMLWQGLMSQDKEQNKRMWSVALLAQGLVLLTIITNANGLSNERCLIKSPNEFLSRLGGESNDYANSSLLCRTRMFPCKKFNNHRWKWIHYHVFCGGEISGNNLPNMNTQYIQSQCCIRTMLCLYIPFTWFRHV